MEPFCNSFALKNVSNDTVRLYQLVTIPNAEYTHLLRKGKYHCMADLLFQLLCLCCIRYRFTSLVESKPVKQEVSHTSPYKVSECSLPNDNFQRAVK